MSIRLNKVTRDLNVGMSTLVEFLQKVGHVVENNPNTKITEEEYELLVKEFSKDMSLKQEAEKLVQERSKREKPATVAAEPVFVPEVENEKEASQESRVQIKTVGRIDLDALKPKSKPVQTPEIKKEVVEKAAPEPKPEVVVPKIEKEPVVAVEPIAPVVEPKAAPVVEPKAAPSVVSQETAKTKVPKTESPKTVEQTPVLKKEEKAKAEVKTEMAEKKPAAEASAPVAEVNEKKEPEIFSLGAKRFESNIKVIKTIDLAALNQSTRPKKKSQAEKKKEREEKQAQTQKVITPPSSGIAKPNLETGDANAQKKKRSRIKDGKVRVADVQNQAQPQQRPHNNQEVKSRLKKPVLKSEVNTEDVSKQVKETLARLTAKPKKGTKYRRDKREAGSQRRQEEAELERLESQTIKITEFVTVNDLANMMDVPVVQVISMCMSLGQMVSINQRLDAETINFVAEEFGFKTEYVSAEVMEAIQDEEDNEEDLVPRPPIVTVMGHVDHGKTSLLDYVRNANVIAGEAGGITQHIGAYNVKLEDGRKITFLDTPGHEAFTAMRARGAQVTDIAIIIIAADASVMPTTREAIAHAQAANVPMVFAINKIDKPGANPDKIREDLANMKLLVEEWGGKYQCQEISAKKGIGVKELLEKVLLEAEMLDLKANPNRKATGSIIESSLDKGRGYMSTVLVSNGTLRAGDVVVAGTAWGGIRAVLEERDRGVEEAARSGPVIIRGLSGAPQAGDSFHVR